LNCLKGVAEYEPGTGTKNDNRLTKALPFTEASLARAIKGVERAGRFVIGVRADGTLIVGDKPIDTASLISLDSHNAPASKWEDQRA
jgi:hypothetical protein